VSVYEKPVKMLFRDMVKDLSFKKSDIIERERVNSWFKKNYPLIKSSTISAHLLRLSVNAPSRIHHNVDSKDDFLFQIDSKKFRLYDPESDPTPIYSKPEKTNNIENEVIEEPEAENGNEFAYEKDLQNFLAKNLPLLEPGLSLYSDEEINGIEFPVGNRFIDILAVDKNDNYVVIELKVSRGYDRVVGQILRYMAWIRKNHADDQQKVRGVIIAREITDDLLLACSETDNVELFEYNLSVTLNRIKK
jgi:hypothetical protein